MNKREAAMGTRVFLGVLFLAMLLSCTSGGVCAPAAPPGLPAGAPNYCGECRANMVAIAEQCVIYYAIHNTYPENLFQLSPPFSLMVCPKCGLSYTMFSFENPPGCDNFVVACPDPTDPNHGDIRNGIASWNP
jgi:hypothetical protein